MVATRARRRSEFSCNRRRSATVLPPTLKLTELCEPPAQCALHSPKRGIELSRDLPKAESLEVRPLDDRPLKLRQAKELATQPIAALRRFLAGSQAVLRRLWHSSRLEPRIIRKSSLGARRLSSEAVDKVPPGDQHHPRDELRALRVETIRRLPEPHEYLLDCIFGLCPRAEHLSSGLENKRSKAGIQLLDRRLVIGGDALHEFPVDALLTLQKETLRRVGLSPRYRRSARNPRRSAFQPK